MPSVGTGRHTLGLLQCPYTVQCQPCTVSAHCETRPDSTQAEKNPMAFSVEEFHDLVRILEERPEWRSELRRLILTDQLLALPEQMTELRAYIEQRFQEL